MRAFELAACIPWAIQEEWLQTILEIAARENPSPEAVSAQLGRPLDNTYSVETRDGVAILPVNGPLFRYANLFSMISGATSTEMLALDFNAALENPNVRAILLDIDSPGGEAAGVGEFAGMVYAARGRKPMCAYVGGTGASAAYWIASAADEVVVAPTAIVGSIGVVAAYRDTRGRDERSGVKTVEFVSSQSPNKRPDPTTETGKSQIQQMVDALAAVFVADVARNRNVDTEAVVERYGAGGVLVGAAAVEAGMVDRLGTFEGVLAELAARAKEPAGNWVASRDDKPSLESGQHPRATVPPAGTSGQRPGAGSGREGRMDEERGGATPEQRLAALEAELAAERGRSRTLLLEKLESDVDAFCERAAREEHLMPYEAKAAHDLLSQAVRSDLEHGTTLAAGFRSFVEARKPHGLTKELLPDGNIGVALPSSRGGSEEASEIERLRTMSAARANGGRTPARNGGR